MVALLDGETRGKYLHEWAKALDDSFDRTAGQPSLRDEISYRDGLFGYEQGDDCMCAFEVDAPLAAKLVKCGFDGWTHNSHAGDS